MAATSPTNTYQAIVVGVGGVGSAALFHLARRGARVLGLDRFQPPHGRGSSHGETRIIRLAYFEHPDYVPLLRRAYELWRALAQDSGKELYRQTGLLQAGPADGHILPAVLDCALRHDLQVEPLSAAETRRRYPQFGMPESMSAVYEESAGSLAVEDCVLAHLRAAATAGAELRTDEQVLGWSVVDGLVEVRTAGHTYRAERLVIAAGAWTPRLLDSIGVPVAVRRKSLFWFPAGHDARYAATDGCPAFLFETPYGIFYGLPDLGGGQVKVAEHSGGLTVRDPLTVDRDVDPRDVTQIERFLAAHLPALAPPHTQHAVCLYTMTADEHFVVDTHPHHPEVVFAAGLSGHGFKFTCVLGEALAQLSLDGSTPLPIEFLSHTRFHSAS